MKTVFNNSEICHVWANNFDTNREGRASNIFFDGVDIFSYGRHFMLATKINLNGTWYTFVNSASYSNSTSKHQNHLRRALYLHDNVIYFPFVQGRFSIAYMRTTLANLEALAIESFEKQLKAKTNWTYYINGLSYLNILERLCQIVGYEYTLQDSIYELRAKSYASSNLARVASELKEQKRKEKAEREREIWLKSDSEKLELWLNNEYNGQLYNIPVHLRFSKDRSSIQTTKGASVSSKEAFVLLQKLHNGQDCKGERIGSFTVQENTLDFVRIGCHVIEWKVINQFFNQ